MLKIAILCGKKNLFCSNLTKYLTFQGSSLQDGLRIKYDLVANLKIGVSASAAFVSYGLFAQLGPFLAYEF